MVILGQKGVNLGVFGGFWGLKQGGSQGGGGFGGFQYGDPVGAGYRGFSGVVFQTVIWGFCCREAICGGL
jgi:hypothetical protein